MYIHTNLPIYIYVYLIITDSINTHMNVYTKVKHY